MYLSTVLFQWGEYYKERGAVYEFYFVRLSDGLCPGKGPVILVVLLVVVVIVDKLMSVTMGHLAIVTKVKRST